MDKFFDEPVVEDEFETPPKAAKAEDVQFLLLIKQDDIPQLDDQDEEVVILEEDQNKD